MFINSILKQSTEKENFKEKGIVIIEIIAQGKCDPKP